MGVNDDNDDDCIIVKDEETIKKISNKTNYSLEMFQEIFAIYETDVTIDKFVEEQGSSRGDNYTAALYRVLLKGNIKCESDNKKLKWEKSIICKKLPDSKARCMAYRSEELFRNEVQFYTKILPELILFEKTKTDETFKAVPKCFFAESDLLILEDLLVRDFKMPDRKAGLTLEQTEAVIIELAKFHSLSLAYKEQHPKKFEKLTNKITEGIFSEKNKDWYENYYNRLTINAVEMVSQTINVESHYIKRMKNFIDPETFFNEMVNLLSEPGKLAVICHGDCWTNNFLYKYNDDGTIMDVQFIDFQLIRYGSLTLDLVNLLYCCTDQNLRKIHMDSLLKLYKRELLKALKCLGPLPEFCKNDEEFWILFQNELKKYGRFGLGLALDIIPISVSTTESAPDLYLYIESSDEIKISSAPELNVPPSELWRKKITDIVTDMVDADML